MSEINRQVNEVRHVLRRFRPHMPPPPVAGDLSSGTYYQDELRALFNAVARAVNEPRLQDDE